MIVSSMRHAKRATRESCREQRGRFACATRIDGAPSMVPPDGDRVQSGGRTPPRGAAVARAGRAGRPTACGWTWRRRIAPAMPSALAREAVQGGAPMVVAAGGDGTIAEVANGLMGSGARLGVIPLGTANVLAHELALPFAPRAVAAALAFGRTRTLWPGVARGADGVAAVRADAGRRVRRAGGARAAAAAEAGARPRRLCGADRCGRLGATDSRRSVCGSTGMETEAASVIVSKGRLYGGQIPAGAGAAAGANPASRWCCSSAAGRSRRCATARRCRLERLGRAAGVRHVRARRDRGDRQHAKVPAQTDGDAAAARRCRWPMRPCRFPVVVG